MSSIPITTKGFSRIQQSLEELRAERPVVIKAIALAREEGDLRENAGYDAARERQGMLEAKISYIESRIPQYDVIDLTTLSGDSVTFGATVHLEDLETEEKKVYTLIGPDETDWYEGGISILSPVARALLGAREGDEVVVQTPRGKIEYEVLAIEYGKDLPMKDV